MFLRIKRLLFGIIFILVIIYLTIFVPVIFNRYPLVIVSGSMKPTYQVGSIIYCHKQDDYVKGNILVYRHGKKIISHRIVERFDGGFITKGDSNNKKDPYVVKDNQVIGRGTDFSVSFIGYYATFVYKNIELFYMAMLFIVLNVID